MNWVAENLMIFTNAKIVGYLGLCLGIIGTILVAIEVFMVFHGPLTLDEETVRKRQGGKGTTFKVGVPYEHVINPDYEKFEKRKRTILRIGLYFLVAGLVMQIISL